MKHEDVISGANCGIVGINEDLDVFGGYDNKIDAAGATTTCPELAEEYSELMSREEKYKLADRMISLWQRYKDAAI